MLKFPGVQQEARLQGFQVAAKQSPTQHVAQVHDVGPRLSQRESL